MAATVQSFIDQLTLNHRVVLIGGVAVIAHGYSRHTQDADIWLDPMSSAEEWAAAILSVCETVKGATIHRLPGWTEVFGAQLASAVEETGMVRILGLDCPLDIFRRPNEFEESEFEAVASRTSRSGDGTLLPDPIDLIQSKLETGRDKDFHDIQHLESVVRTDYKNRLPTASLEEAEAMLGRYSEWQVLLPALQNPSAEVRELAMTHLREFAAAGDPFSQAILEGRELP
jgi:hypothetical protein